MAQLIKINQCISRYQMNFRSYANRYHWLKKRRYAEWKEDWERVHSIQKSDDDADKYKNQMKDEFEDWFFDKQLEWSTRTAFEWSSCPDTIYSEHWLRRFIKEINDVSFFMYRPVLLTRSGPVQLDSLLIANDMICCVQPLLSDPGDVFQTASQRNWNVITNGAVRPLLNPLISLRRSKAVVSAFLQSKGVPDMDVEMIVYAPDCYIEYKGSKPEGFFVDLRNEAAWFQKVNQHSLLIKRGQIECVEALLDDSETVSEPRTS
ncbi:hypothetical protein NIE88_03755 [Sporolactobacillus shoreicorticis]|uniref:NERD domain-containing protein n=1 Tax=Sporolactobacillus shoreicorticis TaxID=1923877 RepID=A0ABW5RYD8_9BACL|nr:hypothetical protein [Sporolactobacillus shoreicorticis]MCO7124890.1 hypothetical protein [Sporolactobacillus shoreicorticis]